MVRLSQSSFFSCAAPPRNKRAHIIGVKVSEITKEIKMATANVMANSRNKRPTTSAINNKGINTAIKDKVRETKVKLICFAPLSAAFIGVSPSSICRAIFSNITMASSTTNPVAMVSAIRVRLLSEKPSTYITAKVPINDKGTTMEGIKVAVRRFKNKNVTSTTKPTASINSNCTSLTAARMVCVRSVKILTSRLAGKLAIILGNNASTRSTTSITLAPGWR